MKPFVLALLALCGASGLDIARAADLPLSFARPAIADGPDRAYFQGLGAGVHIGGAFTSIAIDDGYGDTFDGISADGVAGGAHVEYLFRAGDFRFGPYAEGGLSAINTRAEFIDVLNQTCYYGGGLKAGAVIHKATLLFARVGYERQCWEFAENTDVDVDALVLGGGLETMVSEHMSVGLSADYIIPLSIDADRVSGTDLQDVFGDSEQGRVFLRATYRQ